MIWGENIDLIAGWTFIAEIQEKPKYVSVVKFKYSYGNKKMYKKICVFFVLTRGIPFKSFNGKRKKLK